MEGVTRVEWVRFDTAWSRGVRKVTITTLPQAPLAPKRRAARTGLVTRGNRPDYRRVRVIVDGEKLAPVAGHPGRLGVPLEKIAAKKRRRRNPAHEALMARHAAAREDRQRCHRETQEAMRIDSKAYRRAQRLKSIRPELETQSVAIPTIQGSSPLASRISR